MDSTKDRGAWFAKRHLGATDEPPGEFEGFVDVAEHVLDADAVHQAVLGHGEHRLGVDAGQQKPRAAPAALVVKFLQRVHSGGVDGGDVTHSQDEYLWAAFKAAERVLEAVGDAEKERAVDLVHFHAGRHVAQGDGVGVFQFGQAGVGFVQLVADRADVGDLASSVS